MMKKEHVVKGLELEVMPYDQRPPVVRTPGGSA